MALQIHFNFMKGEVAVNRRVDTKSYTSLHALVNGMFPPISSSPEQVCCLSNCVQIISISIHHLSIDQRLVSVYSGVMVTSW
jgi:hypothetical protein